MKTWKEFKENRKDLAVNYSNLLKDVPQDSIHHPEGSALIHSQLVRKAIPKAIRELVLLKSKPEFSYILEDLNFEISKEEMQILKISAWLHDIGKATATTIGGVFWKDGKEGRIQSIGHEQPHHYLPNIEKMKPFAPEETKNLYLNNKDLIDFIITHHMDFTSKGGFPKKFVAENFLNGKVIPSQKIKLLLVLMWADKMGRVPEETIADCIAKNSSNLKASSQRSINSVPVKVDKNPFKGNPQAFVQLLNSKGLDRDSKFKATKNKFPELTDIELSVLIPESFKMFMENSQLPKTIKANIVVPKEVDVLSHVLTSDDPNALMYVVGGAVRDYLYNVFNVNIGGFIPKDVDLTTNLTEKEILEKLRSPKFKEFNISVNEKESIDTFGVVFVSVNGSETFEIAPFRKDIGSVDGRRPEKVERGTIHDDAMRRDLTINNLYYDIKNKVILDFNENGQGIEDIKNKTARMVGSPFERFEEDKLRVLRFVRFFSRFNSGNIVENTDQQTLKAIDQYKNLYEFKGITPERVQMEFLAGIKQSMNTSSFIKNYIDVGLIEAVFPGVNVDKSSFQRIENSKNPKIVIAWLLRNNKQVGQYLNKIKYSNEISEPVQFLIDVLSFGTEQAVQIVKIRDKRIVKIGKSKQELNQQEMELNNKIKDEMHQDLSDLSQLVGKDLEGSDRVKRIQHLSQYQPPEVNGEDLMKQGFVGKQIGDQQSKMISQDYDNSFQSFLDKKNDV